MPYLGKETSKITVLISLVLPLSKFDFRNALLPLTTLEASRLSYPVRLKLIHV